MPEDSPRTERKADSARYDLLLLGYRNDLARESTLRLLSRLPEELGGPTVVDRDRELPQVLRSAVDHEVGLTLASRLRERGAHVRLVPGEEPDSQVAPLVFRADPGPPGSRFRPLLLLVLLLVTAVAYSRWNPNRRAALPPADASNAGLSAAERFRPLAPFASSRLNDEAVTLNQTGDFSAAAERVKLALKNDPDAPVLRRNLRTILRNWAISELNAGRVDTAVAMLSEALAAGEDPTVLGTLGVAHARKGEWAEAENALERAVELGADEPAVFVALGRVYRQQGNRQDAVEMFHRAREQGASGEEFDTMLARFERELDAEWDFDQMRSAHFEIAFDSGADRAAASVVLDGLERAYFTVGRLLDWYPDGRVQVVLYPQAEFHDITQSPEWTGGVYDGRIKLPVRGLREGDERIDRVLRHEYAHVLVAELTRLRCPTWLNEGVALWVEEAHEGDRVDWALDTIAGKRLFSLRELDAPFVKLPADRVNVAYAESYLAVRSIVERSGQRRLRNLLESLGKGAPLAAAFDETVLTSFAAFEEAFIRSLAG